MALPSWVVLPRTRNDHNSKDGGNKETFFDKGFVLNVLLATHPPRQTLVVAVTLFTGLSPPVPSIPHRTTQTGRVWSACPPLLIDNPIPPLHHLIELYLLPLSFPPRSFSAPTFLDAVTFAHTTPDTPGPINTIHWRCVSALTRISPAPYRSWFFADFLTPACLTQVAPHITPRTYNT